LAVFICAPHSPGRYATSSNLRPSLIALRGCAPVLYFRW
jgi:hypothetical protein